MELVKKSKIRPLRFSPYIDLYLISLPKRKLLKGLKNYQMTNRVRTRRHRSAAQYACRGTRRTRRGAEARKRTRKTHAVVTSDRPLKMPIFPL